MSAIDWLDQLPALLIILPMLTAPLCVLLRKPLLAWLVAVVVTWICLWMSTHLMWEVLRSADGFISYKLGGWDPPWGIELRLEPINAFVLVIVTSISAIVLTASPRSLAREIKIDKQYLFYAAYLLCMTGLMGMTSAGDAFNVFVFLEISSLASYSLIAMGPTRRGLSAAFRYLIIGTVGGTLILLGVGMLYASTGTLNIVDLGERLQLLGLNRAVLIALACIVVGTSIKLALFPLGYWLPNAYAYAPSVVTAFLAATATKVSYYVMVRFLFRVFGIELVFGQLHLERVLMPVALLAMFVGAAAAIYQSDVKRLLAYSSLSQIGYMVLGLSFVTVTGLTGGIVHLFNHAMTKSGLFLCMACLALRLGSTRLDDLRGAGKRMPLTMGAFVLGGLSLIGVPLTVGFVSKWYLLSAALETGRWVIALAILLSSLLALIYIWRVVETAYFAPVPEDAKPVAEAPLSLLVPTWLLIGASLYFGIFTSKTAGIAAHAAQSLLGGAP